MKINCLSCGHTIDLDEAYSDYEGQVKCYACGALLEVKLEESLVKSVKFPAPATEYATECPPRGRRKSGN